MALITSLDYLSIPGVPWTSRLAGGLAAATPVSYQGGLSRRYGITLLGAAIRQPPLTGSAASIVLDTSSA